MPFFIPLPNIPLTTPWVLRKWLISMIIWDNSTCFPGHASSAQSIPVKPPRRFVPRNVGLQVFFASLFLCALALSRARMDLNAKPQRRQDAEQNNDGNQGEDRMRMTGKGYWPEELILEMPFFIPLPTIPLTTPWVLRKWLISMIIWDNFACFSGHASPGRSHPVQVSQAMLENLDEDLNGSKTPKLTSLVKPINYTKVYGPRIKSTCKQVRGVKNEVAGKT
jgi:hypothetical protein